MSRGSAVATKSLLVFIFSPVPPALLSSHSSNKSMVVGVIGPASLAGMQRFLKLPPP
jgi:hypothetical protein